MFRAAFEAWYFHSILQAENGGRLDEAEDLLKRFDEDLRKPGHSFGRQAGERYEQLINRLRLLRADDAATPPSGAPGLTGSSLFRAP